MNRMALLVLHLGTSAYFFENLETEKGNSKYQKKK